MTTYYKFLSFDGRPPVAQTRMRWTTPTTDPDTGATIPGRWHSVRSPISMCHNGLHVCTADQAWRWINREMYEAEVDPRDTKSRPDLRGHSEHYPAIIVGYDKMCCRRVRLVRRIDAWDEAASWRLCKMALAAIASLAKPVDETMGIFLALLALEHPPSAADVRTLSRTFYGLVNRTYEHMQRISLHANRALGYALDCNPRVQSVVLAYENIRTGLGAPIDPAIESFFPDLVGR